MKTQKTKDMIKDGKILTEPSSGLPGPGHVPCGSNGHAQTPVPSLRSAARSRQGVRIENKRPKQNASDFPATVSSLCANRSRVLLICDDMTESLSAKIAEWWYSKLAWPLGKTRARKLAELANEIALSNVPSPLPSGLPNCPSRRKIVCAWREYFEDN
jgi:hypothetical protein